MVTSSFHHLRFISKVKPYLSYDALVRTIHTFVFSRLDCYDSLYSGIDPSLLHHLQLVQNLAARMLTGTRWCEHITSVLRSVHWLPVPSRIDFYVLLLVFKCLNSLAPSYLSDVIHRYLPGRALRSEVQMLLVVPRTRLVSKGDRAFSVVS